MNDETVKAFAKVVVGAVRDTSIKNCDSFLRKESLAPVSSRWRKLFLDGDFNGLQSAMIMDCVDETIFSLLSAVDQGVIELFVKSENGEFVNLSEEGMGELGGWYMGSDGWRAQYSQQRFIDDFGDYNPD